MNSNEMVGRRVKMVMNHLLETVTFTAKIERVDGDRVLVRIPERIRAMRWTCWPGRAYWFPRSRAEKFIVEDGGAR